MKNQLDNSAITKDNHAPPVEGLKNNEEFSIKDLPEISKNQSNDREVSSKVNDEVNDNSQNISEHIQSDGHIDKKDHCKDINHLEVPEHNDVNNRDIIVIDQETDEDIISVDNLDEANESVPSIIEEKNKEDIPNSKPSN